jgi:hypothetical protein
MPPVLDGGQGRCFYCAGQLSLQQECHPVKHLLPSPFEFITYIIIAINVLAWGDELVWDTGEVIRLYDRGYFHVSSLFCVVLPFAALACAAILPLLLLAQGRTAAAFKISLLLLLCMIPYVNYFVFSL